MNVICAIRAFIKFVVQPLKVIILHKICFRNFR